MYGRKNLEVKELIDGNGFGYSKDEADKVMDAMEDRIRELKHQVATDCTCDSSKSATLRMDLYKAQQSCNKLKCLALHAMSEYFGYKTLFSNKKKLRTKYGQFANKFYEAYRKAKKELREEK